MNRISVATLALGIVLGAAGYYAADQLLHRLRQETASVPEQVETATPEAVRESAKPDVAARPPRAQPDLPEVPIAIS